MQLTDQGLTRMVRNLVDGVIVAREMGAVGRQGVAARLATVPPGLTCLDPSGDLTAEPLTPEQRSA